MKKKRNPAVYLLFLLFLFCIAGITFISYRTYQKMLSVEKTIDSLDEQLTSQKEQLADKEKLLEEIATGAFNGTFTNSESSDTQGTSADANSVSQDDSHPEPPPADTSAASGTSDSAVPESPASETPQNDTSGDTEHKAVA